MFWPIPVSTDAGSTACFLLQAKGERMAKAVREKYQKRIKAFEEKEKGRQGYAEASEAMKAHRYINEPERLELAERINETWNKVCKLVSDFTAKERAKEQKELSAIEKRFDDLKNRCLLELLPPKVRRIIAKA